LIASSVTKCHRPSSHCYSKIVTRRPAMVACPTYGFEGHHPSVAIASTVITIYWHQPQAKFIHRPAHTHNARPAPLLTRDVRRQRSVLVTKQEMSRLTGHAPHACPAQGTSHARKEACKRSGISICTLMSFTKKHECTLECMINS
jgi:hypothetical protein